MSFKAHRDTDARSCGATTVVEGQSSTYVNSLLWAVHNDPNSHGEGRLIATGQDVIIENKLVIVHTPDHANPDNLGHTDPMTATGSDSVFAY